MTRRERLKVWIESLNNEQKYYIIHELTDFAIDAEHVAFNDTAEAFHYSGTGDILGVIEYDGSEDTPRVKKHKRLLKFFDEQAAIEKEFFPIQSEESKETMKKISSSPIYPWFSFDY